MNHNNSNIKAISDLFSLAADGEINDEQFEVLKTLLKNNKAARKYYYSLVNIEVLLRGIKESYEENQESMPAIEYWHELAEYEKIAPEIELVQEKPHRELVQKVVYPPREKRKTSKFSIIFLAMNAAAILFFVLFLKLIPPKRSVEVATLTDSINAKWANVTGSMDKGERLATRSNELFLREGLAELLFDNNAKVVIEGPAEFELLTEDQINLRYGRIYAAVPRQAIGFIINTPTSRIIDLGTEFGVQADAYGDVYLHVIKGKTTLIAGDKSNKANVEVQAGQAKKISGTTLDVSDIPCETQLFVRDINSENRFVWKGQMKLDLADVVGGGNGFGTGRLDEGISLSDGAMESDYRGEGLRGTGDYISVPGSTFVDGVFVPGVTEKPVRISSAGHRFDRCPATSGYYTVLKNGGIAKEWKGTVYPLELNGQIYGTRGNSVLQIRANAGITFDLDAIRRAAPRCQVQAFRSVVGVSSNTEQVSKIEQTEVDGKIVDVFSNREGKIGKADVFVLVDGQLRQTASLTPDPNTIVNMDIKLTLQDRFLTLVSTQGDNEWTHDWVIFAKPYLILNTAE